MSVLQVLSRRAGSYRVHFSAMGFDGSPPNGSPLLTMGLVQWDGPLRWVGNFQWPLQWPLKITNPLQWAIESYPPIAMAHCMGH